MQTAGIFCPDPEKDIQEPVSNFYHRGKSASERTGSDTTRPSEREAKSVSERKYKKAEEWTDDIPDPEEEAPEDNDQPYRDGSSKNECWNEEQR